MLLDVIDMSSHDHKRWNTMASTEALETDAAEHLQPFVRGRAPKPGRKGVQSWAVTWQSRRKSQWLWLSDLSGLGNGMVMVGGANVR